MKRKTIRLAIVLSCLTLSIVAGQSAYGQTKIEVLADAALAKVVPKSFYFAGQSADTQMRNTAAAKFGENRYVIAGLVDTSGYSTDISGKYEGFLITDSPIKFGDKNLAVGSYGFGFSSDGTVKLFDLGSKQLFSTGIKNDPEMKRPRPLMITSDGKVVRLYKGKTYVTITPN